MKSLLVDAIRAANEAKESEIKLDDSAQLERTGDIEEASNDGTDDVESPQPETDGLELMQTSAGLLLADIVDEDEAEIELEQDEPRYDVTIVQEQAVSEPVTAAAPKVTPLTSGEVPAFERLAFWTPVFCFLFAAVAAGIYSGWNRMAGDTHNADLRALSDHGEAATVAEPSLQEAANSRFPFLDYRASVIPEQVIEAKSAIAKRPPILIEVRERAPAGTTEVDVDTFSSLEAAFNAWLAGDLRRVDLEEILADRVNQGGPHTETDIKLLLQRHPESAVLYHALGTSLAHQSRWPEANTAFARADELAGGGSE